MNIPQAKQIMESKGWDWKKIDWDSYSNDINLQEWLYNEYGYIVKSKTQEYEEVKAAQDMTKAYYNKKEPMQLGLFDDEPYEHPDLSQKPTEESIKSDNKPITIRLEYDEPVFNVVYNQPKQKSKLKIGISRFIETIKQKLTDRNKYLEWREYVQDVLVKNVEIDYIKTEAGSLKVWK